MSDERVDEPHMRARLFSVSSGGKRAASAPRRKRPETARAMHYHLPGQGGVLLADQSAQVRGDGLGVRDEGSGVRSRIRDLGTGFRG